MFHFALAEPTSTYVRMHGRVQPLGDGSLKNIGVEIEEELLEDEKQGVQLYNQTTNDCIIMILIWMVLGHSATKELKGGNWWHASSFVIAIFLFLFISHANTIYLRRLEHHASGDCPLEELQLEALGELRPSSMPVYDMLLWTAGYMQK